MGVKPSRSRCAGPGPVWGIGPARAGYSPSAASSPPAALVAVAVVASCAGMNDRDEGEEDHDGEYEEI